MENQTKNIMELTRGLREDYNRRTFRALKGRILGPERDLRNFEHCGLLAFEIQTELEPYDKLQEIGDLGVVIHAFIKNYRKMLDFSGKEFIEIKTRSFENWTKEHKWLCMACGRDYFGEYFQRKTFVDHSEFGRVSDGAAYRLQKYLDANPRG